jgi:hypothetical protein
LVGLQLIIAVVVGQDTQYVHNERVAIVQWMPKNAILSAEGAGTTDIGLT